MTNPKGRKHQLERVPVRRARRINRRPYDGPQWVNHNYKMPTTGVMLHRSFDNGKTWPAKESKKWIWNNDRTEEELIDWATPVPKDQRAKIDMSAPDSIMHFCHSHYVNSMLKPLTQPKFQVSHNQGGSK